MKQTAQIVKGIGGDQLYQRRARDAFPRLVRQAEAGKPIYYGDLAAEMGMANPRTLNFPLGSVGRTIENLAKKWGEPIPPLQCLVINQADDMPGAGIDWFLIEKGDFAALPKSRRRAIVEAQLVRVTSYGRWREVLAALDIPYIHDDIKDLIDKASRGDAGGESPQHKALKEYVAANPWVINLPRRTQQGKTEVMLPSADVMDVSFRLATEWVAAEVKSLISDEADLLRGLFQCVKYKALMEADQNVNGQARSARAVLVLEGTLTARLLPVKSALGVEVFEGVAPKKSL